MIGLLKCGAALPRLRHCGTLVVGAKWMKQATGVARLHMKTTSEAMEARLQARDMIPADFRIIYRGYMDYYVHLAHNSSAILTFLGIGILYRTFFIEDEPLQFPLETSFSLVGVKNYTQLFVMYAVFFFMMYGMRQISVNYVLRMYYNPTTETYRAVKIGFLPMSTRCHDFQAGTLTRQTKRYFVPWWNGVYEANGNKIMVFEGGFKTYADYNRMFKQ